MPTRLHYGMIAALALPGTTTRVAILVAIATALACTSQVDEHQIVPQHAVPGAIHGSDAGKAAEDTEVAAASPIGVLPAEPDADGPTFGTLYEQVFTSCKEEFCHGGGLAGVDMSSAEAAYASLVGELPFAMGDCAGAAPARVSPGDPDQSLLMLKLRVRPPCGQQMPPGGLLSDESLAMVEAWISAGAPE